jgi:glucitol operon activator protein
MGSFLPFFALFVVLWVFQLWTTHRQAQRFMAEVRQLRTLGETAIGVSSQKRVKPRTFVALSADVDDRVAGAIELKGLTVLAKPRPIPELEGRLLADLARDDSDDRRTRAAAMAARSILREPEPEDGAT